MELSPASDDELEQCIVVSVDVVLVFLVESVVDFFLCCMGGVNKASHTCTDKASHTCTDMVVIYSYSTHFALIPDCGLLNKGIVNT